MDKLSLLKQLGEVSAPDAAVVAHGAALLDEAIEAEEARTPPARLRSDHKGRSERPRRRPSIRTVALAVGAAAAVVVLVTGLLHATNGGQTPKRGSSASDWQLVSAVGSPFRTLSSSTTTGVDCVSDEICYSRNYGKRPSGLFVTTDGGATWHTTAPPPEMPGATVFTLSCSGPLTCAVLSVGNKVPRQLGELAITTDGGKTWRANAIPAPASQRRAFPKALSCAGPTHCMVAAWLNTTQWALLSTVDGGSTWTSTPAPMRGNIWRLRCTSDGSCLAVVLAGTGPTGSVTALTSTDWGKNWARQPTVTFWGGPITLSSCPDATHCVLVNVGGPAGTPYLLATTSNGGASWQVTGPLSGWPNTPTALSCATATRCAIAMATYNRVHQTYGDPIVEQTMNGGRSWTAQTLPTTNPPIDDLYTLLCPPTGDGCFGIAARGARLQAASPVEVSNLPTLTG